jgi:predicted ATPase
MDCTICFRQTKKSKGFQLTSADGHNRGQFDPPLDEAALRKLYELVETGADGRREPDWQLVYRELLKAGALIFKALFETNPSLEKQYRALDTDGKLILQFGEGTETLLALPWEYLFDLEERTPVGTVRPFFRRVGTSIALKPVETKIPRALVAIAEPLTLDRFNGRRVHDLLLSELQPLVKSGRLHLDFLEPPSTPERFARQVAQGHYDIVHFVGHGREGCLAFENDAGDKQLADAGHLCALFGGMSVRFVFLTACLSAQSEEPGDLFSNTATALLRAGVGGVLAMQYSALVEAAFSSAGDIYRALGEKPLEEAVLTARKIRYTGDTKGIETIQWGVPVLYLQTKDGDLFPSAEVGEGSGELRSWPEPSPMIGVPPRDADFVGRGKKLVEVNEALPSSPVSALWGSGGLGKSALATELAWIHRDRGSFPGGIVWVDLSVSTTLESILNAFGDDVRGLPSERKREVVLNHLANIKTLLILDNFERLLNPLRDNPDAEAVRQSELDKIAAFLRTVSSPSRSLLLSRQTPGVDECVIKLDQLDPRESYRLFLEKAYKAGARFQEQDRESIKGICEVLDGYPLALELAAAQTTHMPLHQLKQALQEQMSEILKSPRQGLEERMASVEASLELSYATLSQPAQQLFKRMSVLVGGGNAFSIPIVCNIKEWEAPIRELVDKSLVEFKSNRYSMHAVVRDYARHKLGSRSEKAYRRRSAESFLTLAIHARSMLTSDKAAMGLNILDAERANIYAGMTFFEETADWKKMDDYTAALTRYLDLRGDWKEAEQQLMKMLLIAKEKLNDQEMQSRCLHNAGLFHQHWGNYSAARGFYAQSLEIAQRLGDQSGIASTLHQLGMIAHDQGDYEEARQFYQQSLEIKRRLGDQSGIAGNLAQMSLLEEKVGNLNAALVLIRDAEAIFAKLSALHGTKAKQQRERLERALAQQKR